MSSCVPSQESADTLTQCGAEILGQGGDKELSQRLDFIGLVSIH